eukprot:982293_1
MDSRLLPNSYPISLQEPDKLGCLVQLRQAMDMVNHTELISCTGSLIHVIKPDQLKTVLFVGLNHIRHQLTYEQLFQMKDTFKTIMESKQKKHESQTSNIIPTVPLASGVSLSKAIPVDIITNHICSFLDLLSIYQFSKCDRNVAIITHTPSAIRTLQFNYLDRYPHAHTHSKYYLDSNHVSRHQDLHLIRNVSKLSIISADRSSTQINQLCNKLKHIPHIKHLTIYHEFVSDPETDFDNLTDRDYDESILNTWNSIYNGWPLMKSLESIRFESSYELPLLLSILHQFENDENETYHDFNLKCISFAHCHFYPLQRYERYLIDDPADFSHYLSQYKTMLELILPSRTNSIEALKFEESFFEHTHDHDAVNEAFSNIDRLSSSLSSLKGIVYSDCQESVLPETYEQKEDIFYSITHTILQNISCFKELVSVHVHTQETLLPLLLLTHDVDVFSKTNEICLTVDLSTNGVQLLRKLAQLALDQYDEPFNIEKICLVVDVPDKINKDESYCELFLMLIKQILSRCKRLELFQIVFEIQNRNYSSKECQDCKSKFDVLYYIFEHTNESLMNMSTKNSLTSRFHIKSSHYSHTQECSALSSSTHIDKLSVLLRALSISYLTAFPTGKLVYKFSWNSRDESYSYIQVFDKLLPLKRIFDVQHVTHELNEQFESRESVCTHIHDNRDHAKECISLQCKSSTNVIHNDVQWATDCKYCDNTPWL